MNSIRQKVVVMTLSAREGSNSRFLANTFSCLAQDNFEIVPLDLSQKHIVDYIDQRDSEHPEYPQDDFIETLKIVLEADAWIVFSPVHWCSYPINFKRFMDRFSEALRREELHFTEKMSNKLWGIVLVSGEDPVSYAESFWKIHETICRYNFMCAIPLRGPWFVGAKPNAFVGKEAEIESKLTMFLEELQKACCVLRKNACE